MSREKYCYLCGKIFRGGNIIKERFLDGRKRKVHARCNLKADKVAKNGTNG